MKATPLQIAKKRFDITEENPLKARKLVKDKLVEAVEAIDEGLWIDRVSQAKGLRHVSNKKLLHLLDTLEEVKKAHGSRDALIGEILKLGALPESAKGRFSKWSTPRLWDHYKSAKKRAN